MKRAKGDIAAFWDYSLNIYALPGVAERCISLQDRHSCDVNILLLCLWLAATRRLVLKAPDLEALRRAVAEPNEHFVQPVRAARRWFKQWNDNSGSVEPHASTYTALKEVELLGERLVQTRLIAGLVPNMLDHASTAEAAVRLSFDNYRKLLPEPDLAANELYALVVSAMR